MLDEDQFELPGAPNFSAFLRSELEGILSCIDAKSKLYAGNSINGENPYSIFHVKSGDRIMGMYLLSNDKKNNVFCPYEDIGESIKKGHNLVCGYGIRWDRHPITFP